MNNAARRNDYDGQVGALLQVVKDTNVTALGRYKFPSDSRTHAMSIIDTTTLKEVASVNVSMAGSLADDFGFIYGQLPTPITLTAGKQYYLVSMETANGDSFYGWGGGQNPIVLTSPQVQLAGSAYFFTGKWYADPPAGHMYGPLNMLL